MLHAPLAGSPTAGAALRTYATPTPSVPAPLTTVAPGARAADAALVERTLADLRATPTGALLVDRLLASNARIDVLDDSEFANRGLAGAHASFDPAGPAVNLRRTDLADPARRGLAAVALAHEGTHLLDHQARLDEPFRSQKQREVVALGGPTSAAGAEAFAQARFELTQVRESRAFTFAGQVARELGATPALQPGDPTLVAADGANDLDTYRRVWAAVAASPAYNPDGRSAVPRTY